jgi:alpha-N-arabinofuranosidase
VLRVEPVAPSMPTAKYGDVPVLDAVATSDGDGMAVFAVNRHTAEPVVLEVDLRSLPGARLVETASISDSDVYATNTRDDPERVVPHPLAEAAVDGGRLRAVLPAASWAALRLTTA